MHEASLAANMLRILGKAMQGREGRVVKAVVSVGALASVMPDALTFAFDALKKDTPFRDTALVLERENVTAMCTDCRQKYSPAAFPYICPACGSRAFSIVSGDEVYMKNMELQK